MADLTGDSVTAATLAQGATAHGADGEPITGTASFGGGIPNPVTAGDTPVLFNPAVAKATSSSTYTATGIKLTIPRNGAYRITFIMAEGSGATRWAQIFLNGSYYTGFSINSHEPTKVCSIDILSCTAGDEIELWQKGGSLDGRPAGIVGRLTASILWDNGF